MIVALRMSTGGFSWRLYVEGYCGPIPADVSCAVIVGAADAVAGAGEADPELVRAAPEAQPATTSIARMTAAVISRAPDRRMAQISYLTSSNTSGAPVGAIRTSRRGACWVTCITSGNCIPAGTFTFSTAPTLTVTTFATPSPDRRMAQISYLTSSNTSGAPVK